MYSFKQNYKTALIVLCALFSQGTFRAMADEEARAYGEYLAGECTTCHTKGSKVSNDTGIPPLVDISGWEVASFIEIMTSFKTGDRDNPAMVSVANALDDEQLRALASYFASLKPQDDQTSQGNKVEAKLLEPFKWSPEILKLARTGNPKKGQPIAEEAGCSGCHGENGISPDPAMPNLAGQVPTYILKQLYDFKHGDRRSDFMADPVKELDLQKMADLAAWYSGSAPASVAKKGAEAVNLAVKGDKSRFLIGCDLCHGKDGSGGNTETPRIGGQKRDYLLATLQAFADGTRSNDHYARMRKILKRLKKKEIEQLADYYAESAPPDGKAGQAPAMMAAVAAQADSGGKKAWRKCRSCHSLKKGGRHKSGPNLYGVYGRTAGKAAGYRYSDSLKKKSAEGLVWTAANLDKWLQNPRSFIGGRTKMSVKTRDPKIRSAVIGYLEKFAK